MIALLPLFAIAKSPSINPAQENTKKARALRWDPPNVDVPVSSISASPACSLPDVLKQAVARATELINHLQNFDAHEQVRYEQTDGFGIPNMAVTARFDYLVDFGEQPGALKVHETRTPLSGTDDQQVRPLLDKGLPVLALIFHPNLQSDYEMRCEGFSEWNNVPAWVIYFSQIKGKRVRTLSMGTATSVYPVSLKGRAWLAADSGQLMHLETNLIQGIPIIELQSNAISVDYAPVRFKSQSLEIWLPQSAVAYTDYGKRRTIIEHTFSDFQLFSVQTKQVIGEPKQPPR
ncbi:MAG: hypothetical protein WBY66_20910 [Candidatus Acidiferrales bacterium]